MPSSHFWEEIVFFYKFIVWVYIQTSSLRVKILLNFFAKIILLGWNMKKQKMFHSWWHIWNFLESDLDRIGWLKFFLDQIWIGSFYENSRETLIVLLNYTRHSRNVAVFLTWSRNLFHFLLQRLVLQKDFDIGSWNRTHHHP